MTACSRCGATDNRHSMKCLQAMALGMAMGIEPTPARDDGRLAQVEADNRVLRRLLHDLLVPSQPLRRVTDPLPEPTSTKLPLGYLDDLIRQQAAEAAVSPERLADIEREVASLNESPLLDVTVHDPLNATVRPKRDDDYTAEAIDRDTPADEPTPTEVEEAFHAADMARHEAEPEPVYDWPAIVKGILAKYDWSTDQLGEAVGGTGSIASCWARGKYNPGPARQQLLLELRDADVLPERFAGIKRRVQVQPLTIQAEEAAREFVDTHVVRREPGERRRDDAGRPWPMFFTPEELLAAYTTWAEASGKPVIPSSSRQLGMFATRNPAVQVKQQGPLLNGKKPNCYMGATLVGASQPAEPPAETPAEPSPPVSKAELAARQTEAMRKLLAASKPEPIEEHHPTEAVTPPPAPDELALKLAQLKQHGIGGPHGVPRGIAAAAVADLHPTGRDVWKWLPPVNPDKGLTDAELDATAYQLLVKCMSGLPDEFGFDYSPDVLATQGFVEDDVVAAIRTPHRVEIRPESWDREKRYPILGFIRGDVHAILGMRTPARPRVIAAYWKALDTHPDRHVTSGVSSPSKKIAALPTRPGQVIDRLRALGCEIPDPGPDELPVTVTYKGQDLGKISTTHKTSKLASQSAYQRVTRKMEAIDRTLVPA